MKWLSLIAALFFAPVTFLFGVFLALRFVLRIETKKTRGEKKASHANKQTIESA